MRAFVLKLPFTSFFGCGTLKTDNFCLEDSCSKGFDSQSDQTVFVELCWVLVRIEPVYIIDDDIQLQQGMQVLLEQHACWCLFAHFGESLIVCLKKTTTAAYTLMSPFGQCYNAFCNFCLSTQPQWIFVKQSECG